MSQRSGRNGVRQPRYESQMCIEKPFQSFPGIVKRNDILVIYAEFGLLNLTSNGLDNLLRYVLETLRIDGDVSECRKWCANEENLLLIYPKTGFHEFVEDENAITPGCSCVFFDHPVERMLWAIYKLYFKNNPRYTPEEAKTILHQTFEDALTVHMGKSRVHEIADISHISDYLKGFVGEIRILSAYNETFIESCIDMVPALKSRKNLIQKFASLALPSTDSMTFPKNKKIALIGYSVGRHLLPFKNYPQVNVFISRCAFYNP